MQSMQNMHDVNNWQAGFNPNHKSTKFIRLTHKAAAGSFSLCARIQNKSFTSYIHTSHQRRHYIVLIYPPTSNSRPMFPRNTGKRKRTNFPNSPHAMQTQRLLLASSGGSVRRNAFQFSRGSTQSVGRMSTRTCRLNAESTPSFRNFPSTKQQRKLCALIWGLGVLGFHATAIASDKHLYAPVRLTMS